MSVRRARVALGVFLSTCAILFSVAYLTKAGWGPHPRNEAPVPIPPPPTVVMETGEWNTFHGDAALRGVAEASFADQLDVLWRLKTRAPVEQAPVISQGRLFVATTRGEVIAADLDGKELWAREFFTGETANGQPVRRRIEAPPACFDGTVFVGTDEGALLALEAASGRDLWQAKLESPVRGAPNGLPGRVYAIDRANGVPVCLDAKSGVVIARGEGVGRSDAPVSVSSEAIVYGSCACAVHVCSPNDVKRLRDIKFDGDSQVAGGVALADGHIISGCRSGKVVEADIASGTVLWTNSEGAAEVFATPAVNAEWVIACCYDGFVNAIDRRTGKTRWRYDTKGMPLSPVIAGDKVIVSVDGELLLLRLADGTKAWSLKISDQITEPAVTRHHVYVGSEDGSLICLASSRTEPPINTDTH